MSSAPVLSLCGAQTEPQTEPQGNRDMRSEEGPGGAGGGGGSPYFLTSFYRSSRCMGVGVWVYIILLYVQCHVIYTQLRCGHVNIHLQNPYRLNTGKAIYPHQMVLNIYSGGGSCSPCPLL